MDDALASRTGIVVAFSERTGGLSTPPYVSLNLAGHVGDDPLVVDENRSRLLSALGFPGLRYRLTTAEQVHGDRIVLVEDAESGSGAWVSGSRAPLKDTDALITTTPGVPLMMMFADCVPIVLVSLGRGHPGVAVVHAGWRGALAGLPASAARTLAHATGRACGDILVYVGPHICAEHYPVDESLLSQFENRFGTVSRVCPSGLDLAAAVSENLAEAGVPMSAQCRLDACTAEHADRFYSYRAERITGRHGAIAAILRQVT